MNFAEASRIADNHDVVLVGYRGVDGSVRARLPRGRVGPEALRPGFLGEGVPARLRRRLPRLRDAAHAPTASTSPATRCPSGSTTSRLRASRSATVAIDLISESAGTRTAMIYAWRYPKSIHRSVMIGVNPPGHFLYDPKDDRRADPPLLATSARRTPSCSDADETTSPRR